MLQYGDQDALTAAFSLLSPLMDNCTESGFFFRRDCWLMKIMFEKHSVNWEEFHLSWIIWKTTLKKQIPIVWTWLTWRKSPTSSANSFALAKISYLSLVKVVSRYWRSYQELRKTRICKSVLRSLCVTLQLPMVRYDPPLSVMTWLTKNRRDQSGNSTRWRSWRIEPYARRRHTELYPSCSLPWGDGSFLHFQ